MKIFYAFCCFIVLSFPIFAQKAENKNELTLEEKESIEEAREAHRKAETSLPCNKTDSLSVKEAETLTKDTMCTKVGMELKKMDPKELEERWKKIMEGICLDLFKIKTIYESMEIKEVTKK